MATSRGREDEKPDCVRAHDLSWCNQGMIDSADACSSRAAPTPLPRVL